MLWDKCCKFFLFVDLYRIESLQFGHKTQQDVKCSVTELSFYSAHNVLFGN